MKKLRDILLERLIELSRLAFVYSPKRARKIAQRFFVSLILLRSKEQVAKMEEGIK